MKIVGFFSNLQGVGTTTLVQHLGHMLAELGREVLLIDLDPQNALTRRYLGDGHSRWSGHPLESLRLWRREGIVVSSQTPRFGQLSVGERVHLVRGDLRWSTFETDLADAWGQALDVDASKQQAALETLLTLRTFVQEAQKAHDADLVLLDLGPSLSTFNLAAFLAVDALVLTRSPLRASRVGIDNLQVVMERWTKGWEARLELAGMPDLARLPPILGHIMLEPDARPHDDDDPLWRFLSKPPGADTPLGTLRHQPSLLALARQVHRPMFRLTPADGAIGAYVSGVIQSREDFRRLAEALQNRLNAAEHG